MDAERFKNEYKHVVLFLKEMGLLKEWKEYCEVRGRQNKKDWWYTLNGEHFHCEKCAEEERAEIMKEINRLKKERVTLLDKKAMGA